MLNQNQSIDSDSSKETIYTCTYGLFCFKELVFLDSDSLVWMFVVEFLSPFEGVVCVFDNGHHLINPMTRNIHTLRLQNSLQVVRIAMNSIPIETISIRHIFSILIHWIALRRL